MSYLRSRFPTFYRLAAYVALLALLVPTATSLVHVPTKTPLFLHICSFVGHINNDQGKDSGHPLPSCPICQSLHLLGSGFAPQEVATFIDPLFIKTTYTITDSNYVLKLAVMPQARPRAPPVLT